jgi:hypothetical protein
MAIFENVSAEYNIPLPVLDVKQMRYLQFFIPINTDNYILQFLVSYYW